MVSSRPASLPPHRGRRSTRTRLTATATTLLAVTLITLAATWAAFTDTTQNPGNTLATGTVTLTDNDTGAHLLDLTGLKAGDTTHGTCITVTYTGTIPAHLRLYGTTGNGPLGGGLDQYLDLKITRGTTNATTFPDCATFTPDTTNYAGLGAGIIYNSTLQAFADTHTAGLHDPRTTTIDEAWTPGETHTYKFQVTLQDTNLAQNKDATQTITFEARNTTLYSQLILSDQPASYWKLDETAGTTAADTAGSATGTYTNGPTLNQPSGVWSGGTAVTFDGSDDWVSAGDVHDYAGTASFSAEFWATRTTLNEATSYRRMLAKERYVSSTDRGGWSVVVNAGSDGSNPNRIAFGRFDGTTGVNRATSTTTMQADTWYHIVATYDGTNMRLYLNGTLEATTASAISAENHTIAMSLASRNGSDRFPGRLDEVAIYTTALSQQQITEHYQTGTR
jgi:hypothetical protein